MLSGDLQPSKLTNLSMSRRLFAIQSEITGVLKGLGFAEEDFTKTVIHPLRRPEDPCGLRQASPLPPGSSSFWTSPPTTWIWSPSPGWKPICSTIPEPCSSWPMTGISWTAWSRKIVEIDQGNVTHLSWATTPPTAMKKAQVRQAQINAYLNQQQRDQATSRKSSPS